MKTITDIYKEYKIFPRLQMHMLRVAAISSMICDNLDMPQDKNLIVTACLMHDLGNIIKSKLDYFPDFSTTELEYWNGVKNEFIKKYGADEHQANLAIIREIGMSDLVVNLADKFHFSLTCQHAEAEDMYAKIVVYSDHRVSPYGVVSYIARMDEAKGRYKDLATFQEGKRQELVACGQEIEKQIFSHCKIKPEDITDEAVAPIIEKLRDFVIK
jgi:hypothetical protein